MLRIHHFHSALPSSSSYSSGSSCSSRRDWGNYFLPLRSPNCAASISMRLHLFPRTRRRFRIASLRNSGGGCPADADPPPRWNGGEQFFQASLLVPETIRHYNLWKQGFLEENKWHPSAQTHLQSKSFKPNAASIGVGFLRRFQSPTIFLKIACDGDLLLPIVVGEFAIERLIDTLRHKENEECPSQFQFVKNLVGRLEHEIKMVRITKRVVNTYYACISIGKPAELGSVSVDCRPSDAIIVANEFQAPIYVSKDIVLKDAIRIVHGTRGRNGSKTVYDVFLDSAIEGPDLLAEELDIVRKMNTAVTEERYKEAAIWRDRLTELRTRKQES